MFYYHKGCWDEFTITYAPRRGLKAKFMGCLYWDYGDNEPSKKHAVKAAAYCSVIEERNGGEGREGTGIIEYFLADPSALRNVIWGPYMYTQDDEEEIDEHDAYQVAYGPPPRVEVCCPW